MQAGEEVEITVRAYWAPEDLMPHDFSIVAWSEKEYLTLEHVSGDQKESTNFPTFEADPAVELPKEFPPWESDRTALPEREYFNLRTDEKKFIYSHYYSEGTFIKMHEIEVIDDNTFRSVIAITDLRSNEDKSYVHTADIFYDGTTVKVTEQITGYLPSVQPCANF